MGLPTNISYGTVVGQFIAAIADTGDVDKLPEGIPLSGTVTFIASPVYILDYSASPNPVTIAKDPIVCSLDSEGYLCSPYVSAGSPLSRGVLLIATDDPDIQPIGWTWTVMYALSGPSGKRIALPTQSIYVPADTTTDLTSVMNVATSNGAIITRGERGYPGDLVPTTVSSWSGAVNLPDYPKTYIATLTGNVTAITLPAGLSPEQSGTITIITKQDAVGGYTLVWPTEILWPEAIEPQPTPGATTVSMFNLLWTGQNWLGILGGKSFA